MAELMPTYPRGGTVGQPEVGPPNAEDLGSPTGGVVAALVLRRFAAGLRGFTQSSLGYLVRQFVHLPGTVCVSQGTIEVTLCRVPLGVVLRMAGRDGEQGTLPWLGDRRLVIRLPDG